MVLVCFVELAADDNFPGGYLLRILHSNDRPIF
jgi:hypothetical protein